MPDAGPVITPVYRWNSWGTNMASSFLSSGTWKVVALRLGPRHSDSGATGVRSLLSESLLGESQLLHLVQAPRPAPSPLPYWEPVFGDFPVLSDASPQWAMCSLRTVTGLWRHTFPHSTVPATPDCPAPGCRRTRLVASLLSFAYSPNGCAFLWTRIWKLLIV